MALKVCTTGTFDVPHIGHANFLRQAAELGDLHVGVLSDEFVRKYKGQEPLYPQFYRRDLIGMLGYNAEVIDSQRNWFIMRRPDIIAVGSDWRPLARYLEQIEATQKDLDDLNISIVFIPYSFGISTSQIVERVIMQRKAVVSGHENFRPQDGSY